MSSIPPITSVLPVNGTAGAPGARIAAPTDAPYPATSVTAAFGAVLDAAPRTLARESVGQRFEAATLTTFVEHILPNADSEFWGGAAGRVWRGVFAEHLAGEIARGHGLGISELIDDVIAKRRDAGPAGASN